MQAEIKLDYKDFMQMKNTIEALEEYKSRIEKGGKNIVVLDYIHGSTLSGNLYIPKITNINAVPHLEDIMVQIRKQYAEILDSQDAFRKKLKEEKVVYKTSHKLSSLFFGFGFALAYLIFYWL